MTLSTTHVSANDSKSICVIPAREGSKRIPLKNIRTFAGKPMIWHSIAAAKKSGLFERIFISTESDKIAAVALEGGGEIPFKRPKCLAGDYTPIADILLHAVKWMTHEGIDFRYLCCIYATAPFIKDEYLQQGYHAVASGKARRAFTVATYPSPIDRALKINCQGLLEPINPEYKGCRTQDFPVSYYNAGQFHWYHRSCFFNSTNSFGDNLAAPIIIPRYLAHDIDTDEDWETAELYYEFLKRKRCVNLSTG